MTAIEDHHPGALPMLLHQTSGEVGSMTSQAIRNEPWHIFAGWWYTYPSEKYESQWEGLSHISWKNVWICLKPPTSLGFWDLYNGDLIWFFIASWRYRTNYPTIVYNNVLWTCGLPPWNFGLGKVMINFSNFGYPMYFETNPCLKPPISFSLQGSCTGWGCTPIKLTTW